MRTKPKNYLKLQYLHECIKNGKTGNPCSLSIRMGISIRKFFYMVEDLREVGASISYCRKRKTYYYDNDFELLIECKLSITTNGKTLIIDDIL